MNMASPQDYCRHETNDYATASRQTDTPAGTATFKETNELSYVQLFELSLDELSQIAKLSPSSGLTLSAYVRWLDIQRLGRPNYSKPWRRTLVSWVEALQSFGFVQPELERELESWNNNNILVKVLGHRQFPTASDINLAFAYLRITAWYNEQEVELGPNPSQLLDERSTEIFLEDTILKLRNAIMENSKTPPSNYVCRRCGNTGHQLQSCPTNMDPSYDKPPPMDYMCSLCSVVGDHLRSLCPKDSSSSSLLVQRKQKERKERKENRQLAAATRSPPKSESRRRLEEVDRSSSRLLQEELEDVTKTHGQKVTSLEELTKKHGKRSFSARSSRSSSRNHSSQGKKKSRKAGQAMEQFRDMRPNPAEGMTKEEISLAIDDLLNEERERYAGNNDNNIEMANLGSNTAPMDFQNEISEPYTEGGRLKETGNIIFNPDEITLDNSEGGDDHDRMSSTGFRKPGVTPVINHFDDTGYNPFRNMRFGHSIATASASAPASKYSEFVQEMINKRPEMAHVVNNVKKRPTVADMWEVEDPKGPELGTTGDIAGFESLDLSGTETQVPKQSSSSSPADYGQFDGACDERDNERDKNIIMPKGEAMGFGFGKVTFNKVKGATGNVKKELSALGRSNAHTSGNDIPSPASTANTRSFSGPAGRPNIMNNALPKLETTPLGSKKDGGKDTAIPKVQSPQLEAPSTPLVNPHQTTFKEVYNSVRVRPSQDAPWLSSRSTNEFSGIVRKVIEASKDQQLKRAPQVVKVPSRIEEEASSPISQTCLDERESSPNPTDEVVAPERKPDTAQVNYVQQAKARLMKMRVVDELKNFSRNFKLNTPIPKEIAEICKIRSRTQGRRVSREKSKGTPTMDGKASGPPAQVQKKVDEAGDVDIGKN